MRLDYLRYFEHLANTLNYTRAAEELFIAQPTLSVAIKRMEQELGIELFRRSVGCSKIELTEAGSVFLEYVARLLREYDEGLRVARERQGEFDSSMRVGTIYAMQGRFWSSAIQDFTDTCSERPQISIEQAYSPALIDHLRKRNLDVAFASRVAGSEDLNHVLVWSQPLVLGVHKDSLWAKRESVSVRDLMDKDIITYARSSPTAPSIEGLLPVDDMRLHREYADEITMCSLVTSNNSMLALFCYSFLVTAFQDVVCIPISDLPADFHKVYLVSRHETHPKVVSDFIDFMSAYPFPNVLGGGCRIFLASQERLSNTACMSDAAVVSTCGHLIA